MSEPRPAVPFRVGRGRARAGRLRSTVLITALLAGFTTLAAPPAAAAVNVVQLVVLSDGQAPFDSLDGGAGNGLVRTNDTLTYGWNYSSDVASGGSVTFVQTLTTSPLVRFDASNVTQCTGAGAGAISADGHTLTCSVLVDATGVGSVPITVTPTAVVPNGTSIAASLTAGGGALSGGTTSSTVVGRPQLNLQAILSGTAVTASVNGAAGNGFAYSFAVTQTAGARGTELVAAPLTFTADLSAISPHAVLVAGSCGPNDRGGSTLPYGRIGIVGGASAANSVVDSGAVGCSQTGQLVTVTVTGADLSGGSNPTKGAQGSTLSTSLTYLVSGNFTVFVPAGDVTSTIQTTLQYRGFDPTSATGQSNFGSGYEPGGDPGAVTCGYVADNTTRANDNCYSATFAPRQAGYGGYLWTLDSATGGFPPGAATTGTSGDGVVSVGETFFDRLSVYSTNGPALTGPAVCDKWAPADMHILGAGRAYLVNTLLPGADYSVQYAALPMTTDDDRRSTSCGTGTWYDTIAAAGGAGAVNAVRFQYSGTVSNDQYLLFFPQFQVQPNPVGTILATFDGGRFGAAESWNPSFYVRESNSPSYTGNRVTVSDGRLRVTQTNNLGGTQSLLAGGSVTYTLNPVVTRNTGATTPVGGVTVTDTLPACARYEPGSASVPVELIAANNGTDGVPCTGDTGETGPTVVFKLGSIVPGTAIPPITFKATVLRIAPDNTTATNAAVISSDAAVPIDLAKRGTSAGFTVRNQTQFAVSETTSTPQISGDDQITLILAYRNLSGLAVPTLTLVTELPYTGDAKGSVFTGALTYSGVTLPGNATARCTSDPHGTISADPASTANTYTSTCDASTTALRLTVTNLANTSIDALKVKLTPAGSVTGDKYVNTTTGSFVPSGSSTPVALPTTERTQVSVVSSSVSGRVWSDVNDDGLRQAGESASPPLSVALAGINDLGASVTRTTTTAAADGGYSFGGLRAGTYSVTFSGGAPPAGAAFSPRKVGADRSIDSDGAQASGVTGPIVLGAGAAVTAVDQGVSYLPPTITLTPSASTVGFTDPVTLTATVPAAVTGSVTFTDAVVSGPNAGTSIPLGTAPINAGAAAWTGPLPAYGKNTVTATYGGGSLYPAASSAPTAVENTAGVSKLLITQFRLSGPAGPNDQFVQLANTGPVPVPLAGVLVQTDHGPVITLPTSAPTLPVGHAYLLAGAAFSLGSVAAADLTVATLGTTGGVRVLFPDSAGTVSDAVGPNPGFSTGTGLPAIGGQPTEQYAWVRLAQTGALQDTADNASDFALVSTTGGIIGGVQSMLGSPSPRGTSSQLTRVRQLSSTLLDPAAAAGAAPNRIVLPGAPRLLFVRRVITNHTGATIQAARIRIVSLSEANGAARPGGPPAAATAWLHLVNPQAPTGTITVGGQPIAVQNLSVDPPATGNPGGGLNTTLTVPLPPGGLASGQSVAVAFTFTVDRRGTFWFAYDVEA